MPDFSTLVPAGLHHPRVKQYLAIKNATIPNPDNLVCIEGLRMLTEALNAQVAIHCLFVCPTLLRGDLSNQLVQTCIETKVPTFVVSEKVLCSLVDWEGPGGLVALVRLPHFDWSAIPLDKHTAVLVLDGLQIPGNIGTIIRCADGAGVDAVIITNRKQRLTHPKVVRASMGSLFTFPVLDVALPDAIEWLQRHHFKIVTTDTEARLDYRRYDYQGRVAVVMGNEREGIAAPWYEVHDTSVSIPMNGRADSLNVGNASVLLLYEMVYQQGRVKFS